MLKTDIKLGICLKNKQTGQVYRVVQRKRKSNRKAGWHFYIIEKLDNTNLRSFLKYRLIKKYFTIDKTAQVLYSK